MKTPAAKKDIPSGLVNKTSISRLWEPKKKEAWTPFFFFLEVEIDNR